MAGFEVITEADTQQYEVKPQLNRGQGERGKWFQIGEADG
jgi:hypothetical protein